MYILNILKEYADTGMNPTRQVAQSIRMHLEGYLRIACPADFPPGRMLGNFLNICDQKLGLNDEILNGEAKEELEKLVEYANLFHHDTNPAWQNEELNAQELLGFVKRTLAFTGPSK